MGDEYESPSEYSNESCSNELEFSYHSSQGTDADKAIKDLADFIKRGKRDNNKFELEHHVDLPETAALQESGECIKNYVYNR